MIGPRLPVAPRTPSSRYGSRRGLSPTWLRGLVGLATVAFTLVPTSPVQAAVLGPPVTNLTLSLSSDAASATEVTYAIGFVMPAVGAIVAEKDQITLDAPTGTFVAVHRTCAPALTMTDMTTNTSRTSGMCTTTTNADDSRLSIPSPINIGAGDRVQLMVPTLVNPRKVGVHELSIESSINGATPVGFQTVRAGAISGLSLSQSTTALGATQVTYTVGFTTSATGALAAGTGTISVQAPPGSFPSHPDCSSRLTVSDLTTKGSMSAPMCAQTINSDGSQLVISPPIDIGARDDVEVVIPSVRNPAEAGPHDVTVGTSSDGSKSLVFGNSAAHAVSDLTFSATTLAARASEVVYTIGFTTSGSGGLPAGSGTIVVQAAAGTFPVPARCGNAIATITDLVTHASSQDQLCLAKESGDGAKVDLVTPFSIGAGQAVRLVITDLHNPDVPGPTTVSVATSSDAAGFATYTVVGVGIPITALSVAASTLAAGATGVTYTFDFATSAVGALAAGSGDIIVRGPAGTFPANPACGEEAATVTDLTTKASGQDLCTATLTADGTQLQITTPVPIGGGHSVRLAILGLDNPLTRGVRTLSVSTSSNSGESGSYRIVSRFVGWGRCLCCFQPGCGSARCDVRGDVRPAAEWRAGGRLRCHRYHCPPGDFCIVGAVLERRVHSYGPHYKDNRHCEFVLGIARRQPGIFKTCDPRTAERRRQGRARRPRVVQPSQGRFADHMVINVVEWCAAKGSVQDPAGRGHQGSRPRHARALGRVGRGAGVPAERRALFRHHRQRPGDLQ